MWATTIEIYPSAESRKTYKVYISILLYSIDSVRVRFRASTLSHNMVILLIIIIIAFYTHSYKYFAYIFIYISVYPPNNISYIMCEKAHPD